MTFKILYYQLFTYLIRTHNVYQIKWAVEFKVTTS